VAKASDDENSSSVEFMEKLRHLNPDLADRIDGAKFSLSQTRNPMNVQQAASSVRSAMELVKRLFPVGSTASETDNHKKIEAAVDAVEFSIYPGGQLAEANNHLAAKNKIDELRTLLDEKGSNKDDANNVMFHVDPWFESLPLKFQKSRTSAWVAHWSKLSAMLHTSGEVAGEQDVKNSLEFLEGVLSYYFNPTVLESASQIDQIVQRLDENNSEELFEEASALFTNGASLEYFLSKLDDPAWINPLIKREYFTASTRHQKYGAPNQPHLYSPLKYLARVAATNPALTALALRQVEDLTSDSIKGLVVDCAAHCSGLELVEIVKKLVQWEVRKSPHVSFDNLLKITRELLDAHFQSEAFQFARATLAFSLEDQNGVNLVAPFAEWEYGIHCKSLAVMFPQNAKVFSLFSKVLEVGLGLSARTGSKNMSVFWLPSLAKRIEIDRFDSAQTVLAEVLTGHLASVIGDNPRRLDEYLKIIRALEGDFFRRLEYHARGLAAPYALEQSWGLLFSEPLLIKAGAFGEFWLMVKRLCEFSSLDQVQYLSNWLMKLHDDGELSTHTFIRIFSILKSISEEFFGTHLRETLTKTGIPPIDDPEILVKSSPWANDELPINSQTILAIGPEGFIRFLEKFEPEVTFPPQNMYAIAHELRPILQKDPNYLDAVISSAAAFPDVLAVFLDSKIPILAKASDEDVSLWLDSMRASISNIDFPMNSSARLMKGLFTSSHLLKTAKSRQLIWKLLSEILSYATPQVFDDQQVKFDAQIYQTAINDPFSIALDTAIYGLDWSRRNSRPVSEIKDLQGQILGLLSRQSQDNALPVAILGNRFSFITQEFRDWSLELATKLHLTKNKRLMRFFLTCHFNSGHSQRSVLRHHRWIYDKGLKSISGARSDVRQLETQVLTARQLCIFFIQGDLERESNYFDDIRKSVSVEKFELLIREVGHVLARSDSLSTTIQQRSQELWRILEGMHTTAKPGEQPRLASCFSEWLTVTQLPAEWRLLTFRRLLEGGRFVIDDLYSTLEVVSLLALEYPLECIEIAKLIVMRSARKSDLSWSVSFIYGMIEPLKSSALKDVTDAVTDLEEQLARAGYMGQR
jgi:hypothetical protein